MAHYLSAGTRRDMLKKVFKKLDYSLILIVLLLFSIGVTALYSANGGEEGDLSEVYKQLAWFGAGVLIMTVIIMIDYDIIGKFWIPLYGIILILLVLVLFTRPINGARSWFNLGGGITVQPSEFAKIVMIISLAKIVDYFKAKDKLNKLTSLALILLFIALPVGLIVKQPDYGTAMVILVMALFMIFVAGIKWRYVICAVVVTAVALPLAYNFVLPQHAKDRILVFLNPQIDPRGKGYNIIQSKLAVGSGQMWGMGLFKGNQTQLGILPMKKTDFIYSVISEEMGFIISALVVILFVILIVKIINMARNSKDMFGTLICVGVAALFLAHFTENVGMTMGLLPITGIPLPFISYGGSAMLTNFMALGLALNVSARRKKLSFLE